MKWIGLSLLIVIIDQITKYQAAQYLTLRDPVAVISGFNLTLMYNTGAAFSILSQASGWQRWFFIILAGVISILIIIWMLSPSNQRRWLLAALALILGGVLGNLWDRVFLGYVIDFIEVYYKSWFWPVFNVADSAITVGAIMLIIDTLWFDKAAIDK